MYVKVKGRKTPVDGHGELEGLLESVESSGQGEMGSVVGQWGS